MKKLIIIAFPLLFLAACTKDVIPELDGGEREMELIENESFSLYDLEGVESYWEIDTQWLRIDMTLEILVDGTLWIDSIPIARNDATMLSNLRFPSVWGFGYQKLELDVTSDSTLIIYNVKSRDYYAMKTIQLDVDHIVLEGGGNDENYYRKLSLKRIY